MKQKAKNGLQKKKVCEVQKKNSVPDQKKVVFNLSDNELYLSVMKIQEAHEIILQILMGDPKLQLKTIHVEDVILNKSGRKSIRLDAYGEDQEENRYISEMQNDTVQDDVRRRSRFYQGLTDAPILKAGRKTRYKNLPDTTITFITQKDIFESDQARYWFSEQCHDPQGMELGDGTRKCFCNMASKNGDLELVSLLQYMKNTRRDNPDVVFWSERLKRLHEIVEEVRESEEWEEIYMSAYSEILEIGIQEGEKRGERRGEKRGEKRGQEKKTREIIASLAERDFSPGDIAQIVKVSEKYVRQQLKKSHR